MGELAAAEPVSEAGLSHSGVPDHQHLEGAAAAEEARGHGAAQGVGELEGGLHRKDTVRDHGRASGGRSRHSLRGASSVSQTSERANERARVARGLI